MVVTFCGHSSYVEDPTDEKTVIDILEKLSTLGDIKFILGEYGAFDIFSYKCAKKFKDRHPNAELIFITPYAYTEHRKSFDENLNSRFDLIIYPGLEKVPLKYAISRRSRWMIEQSDVVIAYIKNSFGGAYKTYQYAKRKNKSIYNIANSRNKSTPKSD